MLSTRAMSDRCQMLELAEVSATEPRSGSLKLFEKGLHTAMAGLELTLVDKLLPPECWD